MGDEFAFEAALEVVDPLPIATARCLYEARSITKERSAQITKKRSKNATGFAAKNRAPFYFAVIEDLYGLRPRSARRSTSP